MSHHPLLPPAPLPVQPVAAAWRAQWLDSVTSSPVSASVAQERSVSAVTVARQVTGASPAADPASAMDTQTSVTREPEPASTAGATLEETSVTGDNPVPGSGLNRSWSGLVNVLLYVCVMC